MKKIFYLILVFGFVFTACEPLDDINSAIDAKENPIVGDTEYTLTDDDYDELELSYGSFNSEDDAKTMIPSLLSDLYPAWGKSSSVLVNYNLYVGSAFGARDYTLNQADYTSTGSSLLGFQSDATPADYLADILASNISNAKEGDYRVAKYFQFTGSAYTVTPKVSLESNFDYGSTEGDLTSITTDWSAHSGSSAVGYTTSSLSMAGYPTSDIGGSITIKPSNSEDVNSGFTTISSGKVYASALVNLSEVSNGNYFFHIMEAPDTQPYAQFRSRVGAKDNGSGKVLFGIGASSSSLTYGETAFDLNTTYLLVSSYEIETGTSNLYVLTTAEATEPATPEATNTGSSGNAISAVAFRQSGGIPTATIDGVRVANTWSALMTNDALPNEVIGAKESMVSSYVYNGTSWVAPSDNFYLVSEADFASIGIETFGSSTPAEDYLPTFLNLKFPYAQEGEALDVVYNYVSSSSGPQVRGNLYTKIDGAWKGYQSTITTNLQFGHDGTTWVPDNTIKYTLVRNDDYEYMASQLTGAEYAGLIGNLAGYGDFDYNWSDDQIHYALSLLLDHLFPTAPEGQKYSLTYVIYDNGENDYITNFIRQGGAWVVNE